MMLAHPLLQSPIEFKENRVPVLIVENGQLFRRLIGDLLAQENGEPGEFALSENAGLIEIGKNVQMTLNPLFPELDGRRIATKIQQMAVTAAEDQPGKTAECLAALNDYGAALTAADAAASIEYVRSNGCGAWAQVVPYYNSGGAWVRV